MSLRTVREDMRIAGTLSCSLVNGDGVRYVIFTQGCAHHCPECQNPDTWDFTGGYEISVEDLAADIKRHRMIDGITLSGGDPFYQEAECLRLLDLLPGVNVWVYTGFLYKDIADRELTRRADVIVDAPYIAALRCEGQYYGSSNQTIHRKELS